MNINWKLVGKIAASVVILGVTGTTAILVVRHIKKKRDEKKAPFDGEEKENESEKDDKNKDEKIKEVEVVEVESVEKE